MSEAEIDVKAEELRRVLGALNLARKALEWERDRCGRLEGPLSAALKKIYDVLGEEPSGCWYTLDGSELVKVGE